jgi:HAD superfamily hydrolase (TIGR01458 family)
MAQYTTEKIRGVLLDLDGVLEFKGEVYPGAIELTDELRRKGICIRILTNSTLKSRKSCADKLMQKGFTIYEEEIITASFATARYLDKLEPRSCWIMLDGQGLDEFSGYEQDIRQPEYVIVGDYRENFNFRNMNKALKLLLAGSKLIVMISEMVDHSMGDVELTVGAYGKMLEAASGAETIYIGKPSRYMFELAIETMGIPKKQLLMVGDRVESDILGAKSAGIRSVLVKTGEYIEGHRNKIALPDYIVDSIADLRSLDVF